MSILFRHSLIPENDKAVVKHCKLMPISSSLTAARQWSGALRRQVDTRPEFALWLEQAVHTTVDTHRIQNWFAELSDQQAGDSSDDQHTTEQISVTLRLLRQRVFFTLMVRDINGHASLAEIGKAMSALADLTIAQAYRHTAKSLANLHGIPIDPDTGKPQELLIIAMGKLGGNELNVSSDIDLIPLYGNDGQTEGRRKISYHEFYGKLVQRMLPLLSDITSHGQVFRTDLRLRPDGDSGPLAWSLAALEAYLVSQGREWERYAWIKARYIPVQAFEGSDPVQQAAELEGLRIPFVYRKYFDFDALSALRRLRRRIREDWQRRSRARHGVEAANNIKLGDGGIREIEFVVQLTQLIRGGRMPSIQQQGLLATLQSQKQNGVIDAETAVRLEQAYRFLRRTEHMLQYREDEQTHLLPHNPEQRRALASTLQLSTEQFEANLAEHRHFVHKTFRDAFRIAGLGEGADDDMDNNEAGTLSEASLKQTIDQLLGNQGEGLIEQIEQMLASHRIRRLPLSSRQRLDRLLPAILQAAAQTPDAKETTLRLLDLVDAIAPRSAYLALLAEYPETLARVSHIIGASRWAANYLTRYPLLLDSLIEWSPLMEPVQLDIHAARLHDDLDACTLPDGKPDIERQMNLMRDLQRQISFQLLVQDLAGELSVERLADYLSELADRLLDETIRRVWPLVAAREAAGTIPDKPRFAVIAYGKLGGKELGYASDLDLVFIYDDAGSHAAELYTRLGQRMASWLTTLTSSGRLYDVDLRLRPDGDAGVLAISADAFARYQLEHAWPWEHQALTRARFAAGDATVGEHFESIRRQILLLPRDPVQLGKDIREMRQKISVAHPNHSDEFDLKHDEGGMVDVEFVTQYLVLRYARDYPVLLDNLGNIALLQLAAQAGLICATLAEQAADAYRSYRRLQHTLRLDGAEKARVSNTLLTHERTAVRLLWNSVLQA